MLFKHFQYASFKLTMFTSNRSWISFYLLRHCGVILQEIDTKFEHNIHHISRHVCAMFRVSTPSRCRDIAKKLGQNMTPQRLAGGAEAQRPTG